MGALDGAGGGLPVVREGGGTVAVAVSVAAAVGRVISHCRLLAKIT